MFLVLINCFFSNYFLCIIGLDQLIFFSNFFLCIIGLDQLIFFRYNFLCILGLDQLIFFNDYFLCILGLDQLISLIVTSPGWCRVRLLWKQNQTQKSAAELQPWLQQSGAVEKDKDKTLKRNGKLF